MADEPPLRQNLTSQDSDEHLSRVPKVSLPASSLPPGQPANMEFESYPRQHFAMGNFATTSAMDMSSLTATLPDYQMRSFQQQQFPQHYQNSSPNPSMMYQYPHGAQFAGQTVANPGPSFPHQYQSQYVPGTSSRQQQGVNYPQFMGNPVAPGGSQHYQPQPYILQQQQSLATPQQQQQPHFQQHHGATAYGAPYATNVGSAYPLPQFRLDNSLAQAQAQNIYPQINPQAVRRSSSNSSLQTSVLRGPPRKPKQSGHALWVGNLPPSTHIIDLKDHFAQDATNDIESVFLISKSNCAFVNYKTEASCAAAMTRFHDSRFQGVRLVCRLRRGSTSTSAATPVQAGAQQLPATVSDDETTAAAVKEAVVTDEVLTAEPEALEKVKEKFFVVKSLTVEDLERSVASGIWATQAHNETALNEAYQNAENVYLVFSANKSGEYFGYARMESAIDDESVSNVEYQPRPEAPEAGPADLPLTIPTPATATAPKGRIIDDSARGTIFWEADIENKNKDEQELEEEPGNLSGEGEESTSPGAPQTFGKPFKIRWMSTDRLPFYRTRGLRNPWNANREVKIARDGTEIEPSVGRRLVNMFHRAPVPAASPGVARIQQQPPPRGPSGGFMSAPSGMYGRSY